MRTFANNTTFAIATLAVATLVALGSGQQSQAQQYQTQTPQALVVPPVYVTPTPTQQYYFGFSGQLVRANWGGLALRLVSVTPGSPAQRAGLEVGDEIISVNGRGFDGARDSFHAVRMLNQFVTQSSGVAPAAAAYYVGPPAAPTAVAEMIVRNVRNGQNVLINVRPTPKAGSVPPAPAAAAAMEMAP